MLGTALQVNFNFLRSLSEENLITPEDEYEEDYILKVPNVDESVCYMNHGSGSNLMWMYNVLISKFGVRILFIDFQFTVLLRTLVTPS